LSDAVGDIAMQTMNERAWKMDNTSVTLPPIGTSIGGHALWACQVLVNSGA
jgi:uncharacterized protein YfaP (DUF2135 family)